MYPSGYYHEVFFELTATDTELHCWSGWCRLLSANQVHYLSKPNKKTASCALIKPTSLRSSFLLQYFYYGTSISVSSANNLFHTFQAFKLQSLLVHRCLSYAVKLTLHLIDPSSPTTQRTCCEEVTRFVTTYRRDTKANKINLIPLALE